MKYYILNPKLNDLKIVKNSASKYVLCWYDNINDEDDELYVDKNNMLVVGKPIKPHKYYKRINITYNISDAYHKWMSYENLYKLDISVSNDIVRSWLTLLKTKQFIELLDKYFRSKPNNVLEVYLTSTEIRKLLLNCITNKELLEKVTQEKQQSK